MSRTLFLAAAAVIALTAGNAAATPDRGTSLSATRFDAIAHRAKRAKVLWNQNSNFNGDVVNSQNFTSGLYTSSDDQGADDFVVPKGKSWIVTEVDVTGAYSDDGGPAASENVIFYSNNKGAPGKPVKGATFTKLDGTGTDGSFAIGLGKGVKLKPGSYWVSVIINMDDIVFGAWAWAENGTVKGYDAMWQNPGGGQGVCPTWGTLADCISGSPTADLMFTLRGRSK